MRRRIEWAIGAVFVVVVVLIVPIATFDGVTGPPQVDSTQEIASPDALFDLGTPYVLRETRVLPISSSPQGIADRDDPSGILTDDTLEAFLIASEGGMWVVDRPAETVPSGRIRLFGSEEYPTSDFLVPSGAALFAPASDGGLWIGFAVGDDGGEIVRRYSSAGELLGEYPLPENVFARSLSVAPTGELWVQVEESEVDMDTFASTYRSHLLPIAVGEDLTPAPDPRAGALEGNFIGFDGRLYSVSMESIPQGDDEERASVLTALAPDGTSVRFDIPPGYRPFEADSQGRVYCERLSDRRSQDSYHGSIGEGAFGATDVLILEAGDASATVPVAPRMGPNELTAVVQISAEGELLTVKREGDSIRFSILAPDHSENHRRADGELVAPDMGLIGGPSPLSGDPYRALDDVQRDYMSLIYAGLVRHDESLNAVPDIAVSVPKSGSGVSDDGLTIEYEIRGDLTWHDGVAVTGQDVVATWRHLSAPSVVPRGRPFPGFDNIESVSASGQRVTVTLSSPFGAGPESFFPYVLPGHLIDPALSSPNADLWTSPIGCGPYALTRWEESGLWQLQAHDASPRGQIGIETIHVRFAEAEDALLHFQSSTVPTAWSWVDPFMLSDLRRDGVGDLTRNPTGRWIGLLFNTDTEDLADPEVRHTFIETFPIDELNDSVLDIRDDDTTPSLFTRVPGSVSGVSPERLDTRDVSGLIDYAGGLRLGWPEIAYVQLETVEKAWSRAGIPVSRSSGLSDLYASWIDAGFLARDSHEIAEGVFPAYPDAGWGGVFDELDIPSRSNPHGIAVGASHDPVLRELYTQVRAEYDPARRQELSAQIQERLTTLALFMFERAEYRYSATIGSIEEFSPAPYPAGDFWNVESWEIAGGGDR
jgi:ABC-type transport system substrate-binding protein